MNFFRRRPAEDPSPWYPTDVRFDVTPASLALRGGEIEVDSVSPVEDTKVGGKLSTGTLTLTSLRLIWVSLKKQRTNVSVGLATIETMDVKTAASRLHGPSFSVQIICKHSKQRLEFLFTAYQRHEPRLFTVLAEVIKLFDSTRLYRELKLRGAIIKDKSLLLLPEEEIFSKTDGVWNLSADQGNLGILFSTSVRIVWFASLAENFNVSIPYWQIKMDGIKVRDSKFGVALVVETWGGFVLGFRIEPNDKLNGTYKEITRLWEIYNKEPTMGIDKKMLKEITKSTLSGESSSKALKSKESDVEEKEDGMADGTDIMDDDHPDALAQYYIDGEDGSGDGGSANKVDIVFSTELGLAVEKLRDGVTIEDLWTVPT